MVYGWWLGGSHNDCGLFVVSAFEMAPRYRGRLHHDYNHRSFCGRDRAGHHGSRLLVSPSEYRKQQMPDRQHRPILFVQIWRFGHTSVSKQYSVCGSSGRSRNCTELCEGRKRTTQAMLADVVLRKQDRCFLRGHRTGMLRWNSDILCRAVWHAFRVPKQHGFPN